MSNLILKPFNSKYIPTPTYRNYLAPHEPLKVTATPEEFLLNPDFDAGYGSQRAVDLAMVHQSAGKPIYMKGPDRVVYVSSADMLLCRPEYVNSALSVVKRVSVPSVHRYRWSTDTSSCNAFAINDTQILIVTVSSNLKSGPIYLPDFEGGTYVTFRVAEISANDIVFTDYKYLYRNWHAQGSADGHNRVVTSYDALFYNEAAQIVTWPSQSDNHTVTYATENTATDGYVNVVLRYTQYPWPSNVELVWRTTTMSGGSSWIYTIHVSESGIITLPSSFNTIALLPTRVSIHPTGDTTEGKPTFLGVRVSPRHTLGRAHFNPPYRAYVHLFTVHDNLYLQQLNYVEIPLEYTQGLYSAQLVGKMPNGDFRFYCRLQHNESKSYEESYIFMDVNPTTLAITKHDPIDVVTNSGESAVLVFSIFDVLSHDTYLARVSAGSQERILADYEGADRVHPNNLPVGDPNGLAVVKIENGVARYDSEIKATLPEFIPTYMRTSAERGHFDLEIEAPRSSNYLAHYNDTPLTISKLKDDYYLQAGQSGMFRIIKLSDVYAKGPGRRPYPRFPNPNPNPPVGLKPLDVSAGSSHSMAIKGDGTIVTWGSTDHGLANVPAGSDFVQVAGGSTYSLALRSDGSIEAWGNDYENRVSNAPTEAAFSQVSAGVYFCLALKNDGSIVAWGRDLYGSIADVPAASGFTQIAAGAYHGIALRSDGSIVVWGGYIDELRTNVPTGNFVAVAAGRYSCFAIRDDGSIEAWGRETNRAVANAPTDTGYVSVAGGNEFGAAVKENGSIVTWGSNNAGQVLNVPTASNFVKVAVEFEHCVALDKDGRLVSWGRNDERQVIDTPSFADMWVTA